MQGIKEREVRGPGGDVMCFERLSCFISLLCLSHFPKEWIQNHNNNMSLTYLAPILLVPLGATVGATAALMESEKVHPDIEKLYKRNALIGMGVGIALAIVTYGIIEREAVGAFAQAARARF